jgi:hypothetical protein
LAELSASFDNVAEASFGMKKLRQNLVLPYSLYALATAQVLNLTNFLSFQGTYYDMETYSYLLFAEVFIMLINYEIFYLVAKYTLVPIC